MICPKCGAELSAKARFCNKCGYRMEQAEPTNGTEAVVKTEKIESEVQKPEQKPTEKVAQQASTQSEPRAVLPLPQQFSQKRTSKGLTIAIFTLCALMAIAAVAILWIFVISPAICNEGEGTWPNGEPTDDPTAQPLSEMAENTGKTDYEQLQALASAVDTELTKSLPTEAFPDKPLSTDDIQGLDVKQLQYYINCIYAKNGYAFSTPEAAEFFGLMPWYIPVSGDQTEIASRMNATDRDNIDLLLSYRNNTDFDTSITGIDALWTYNALESPLSESFVGSLSACDVQLLAATILAKYGYSFGNGTLKAIFNAQSFYSPTNAITESIAMTSTDRDNLALLQRHLQ